MGTDIEKLRNVAIFKIFSDAMLEEFAKSFRQTEYAADSIIFRERSEGDTLFIIVSGEVVIEKRLDEEGARFKQLAVLSAGEFFGEMAVLEGITRFAQARASADSVLYEIKRSEFFSFIKEHPETGIGIFTEIMKVVSRRLQHTSSELTMLFDIANLVMAGPASAPEFISRMVEEISLYFEGSWNINGWLYNRFNEEFDPVASKETFPAPLDRKEFKGELKSGWLDDSSYLMVFSQRNGPSGYIIFARSEPLSRYEKNSLLTIFNTTASITSSALENIEHRTEEALVRKLQTQKYYI